MPDSTDMWGMAEAPENDTTLLSPRAREIILAKLKEKSEGRGSPCGICSSSSWGIEPRIFSPHAMEYNTSLKQVMPALTYPIYPMCMIVCSNCGHTRMINLSVLDVELELELEKLFASSGDPDG